MGHRPPIIPSFLIPSWSTHRPSPTLALLTLQVKVTIHPPVEPSEYGSVEQLMSETRNRIASALPADKVQQPPAVGGQQKGLLPAA